MTLGFIVADQVTTLCLLTLDHHVNGVAGLELGDAMCVYHLLQWNEALRLEPDIDHQMLVGNLDHSAGNDDLFCGHALGSGGISCLLAVKVRQCGREIGCIIIGLVVGGVDPIEVRRRIGMVFQRPNPFPKSIYDNIAFGLRILGMKDNLDDRVEQALRGAAIWDEVKNRLKRSALGLSGGQQQRLCIARAIAVKPDVILLDEPASALDPISTAKIEELIDELKEDYTIVIVTHNMQQAARVSDFTAFMYLGEMIEFDNTSKMFTAPGDRRTQDYITCRFG